MLQTARLLKSIREKYPISEEFAKVGTDEKYFGDACKFVGLRHELLEAENCLRNCVRYSEMTEL